MTPLKHREVRQAGKGVDALGGPVVDPTQNVLDLSFAASKRQDDLRELTNIYLISKIDCAKEFASIHALHAKELVSLRAEHAKEINALESNRLNAIRQVDVLAVNTAADRSAAAIQALAATTQSNAENLRNALTSTAATIATQTAGTVTAITERLAALEKSSYEGKGKQTLSDPMIQELVTEMKSLRDSRAVVSGKGEGLNMGWVILLGSVGLIGTLITIGAVIFASLKK